MVKCAFARVGARRFMAALAWTVTAGIATLPAIASATLNVTPLTWNVIGLDSNSPATGPQHFPIGARVCSTTGASSVAVQLVWDSANAFVNTRPGSQSTLTLPAIAANGCADAYFEAEVTRDAAAFDTVRRYHISATDGVATAATSTPRELYVEHLISQNRNAITGIKVNGVSVPAGGSVGMVVGNTYTVELDGGTATQGYSQFESFINLSNAIFRIDSVQTTYSADNSPYVPGPAPAVNDKLYADACRWENNPASPNYRSCVGGDFKAGGSNVVTLYTITIVGGGGTAQTLSTLLYDFSGSSFHYNADFAAHAVIANIIDPTALGFTQQFAPASTTPGGTSTLTFTIGNPNAAAVSGAGFSDALPNLAGGQMVIASPATFATAGCGSPTFAPIAGATTLSVGNATIPANGTCTISVLVSVPSSPTTGSYVNTSGNLVVGGLDTGRNTTASLGLSASAPPTNLCGLTLARWTMDPAAGTTVPPAFSFKAADVASAVANIGAGIATSIDTGIGNPVNAWAANGFATATTLSVANNDYFQFAVDTSKYTSITFAFDARLADQSHGPQSLQLFSSTDGVNFTAYSGVLSAGPAFAAFAPAVTGANATGVTWFRIYGWNSANSGNSALIYVDNIKVGGCKTASPPTLGKAFVPATTVVGASSRLTFTLSNPNTAALTGASFSDTFPTGMQVAAVPSASNTCGGTWAPVAGDTSLAFTGGTIPASGSCAVGVDVTVTTPGTHSNVSGFITSIEGGTNATATGSAVATLQALVPPSLAATVVPASVGVDANAVLRFTITNPNAAVALSGVSFSDNHPANLVNANPAVPAVSNTCGGALTANPGGSGVALSGGSIPAAGSCTISVPVTSAVTGAYGITTSAVADAAAGSGNTASASLDVTAPAPGSSVLKQVGTSATGPWFSFVAVAPGTPLYYRFTVENTGDVALDPFGISDPALPQAAGCAWQTPNSPSTLPALPVASATLDPTATCVIGPVLATPGASANTATAQGMFNGTTFASAASTADYVGAVPGFTLVKEVAASPLGPWASAIGVAASGDVFYRFTLVNTGALDLSGISVTDVTLDLSSCTFTDPLVVGDATTCTVGPVTAAGGAGTVVTNTATGHGSNGGTVDTPPSSASYTISNASADVAIANSDGVASVAAGDTTTYTVTVSNNGPGDVTGANVIDTAPAGLTFGAWTCAVTNPGSGGSVVTACGFPGGIGDLNAPVTLQPGAIVTFTIAANVDGAASGSITTTASVAVPGGVFDANAGNDSASDIDAVVVAAPVIADLAVTVTDGTTVVTPGMPVTYTITVSNTGPDAVTGATVSDAFPPQLTAVSWTCAGSSGGSCLPGGTGNLVQSVDLPAGASVTFIAVGTLSPAAIGVLTDSATVTSPAIDPVPGNNSATDTDTVMPLPPPLLNDLAITIDDGISLVPAGAIPVYTITVTNSGSSMVTGAILANPIVPGFVKTDILCGPAPGGQCTVHPTIAELDSGTFALPALAPGATYEIVVIGQVSASSGAVVNTATIAMPSGVTDDVPSNNVASDTDSIIPPPPSAVDVSIDVDNGVTSVMQGASVTYTITVANAGPQNAVGVTVSDAFPPQLAGVTWTCSAALGALCPEQPGTGDISAVVNLPAGSSAVFTATGTVSPIASGTLVDTAAATVSAPAGDADPSNNASTDSDPVVALPANADLAVAASASADTVVPGGSLSYTLIVTNSGPGDVTNAIVTDVAPAGIAFGNWTCVVTNAGSGGSVTTACGAPNGSGNLATSVTMQPGAIIRYAIAASVATGAGGNVVASASVNVPAGTTDPNMANNTLTVAVNVQAAPAMVTQPIPTLSEWGLIVLSLLMLGAAARSMRVGGHTGRLRRRRRMFAGMFRMPDRR